MGKVYQLQNIRSKGSRHEKVKPGKVKQLAEDLFIRVDLDRTDRGYVPVCHWEEGNGLSRRYGSGVLGEHCLFSFASHGIYLMLRAVVLKPTGYPDSILLVVGDY